MDILRAIVIIFFVILFVRSFIDFNRKISIDLISFKYFGTTIVGLEVNGQKAVEYYEKAAALEHSRAMVNLSLLYKNWDSHLVAKDKEKSKYWEDRALEIGQASDVIAIGASKAWAAYFGW